jgi:hypothetical protein
MMSALTKEITKILNNKSTADLVGFFETSSRFSAENMYDFLTEVNFLRLWIGIKDG